MKVTKLKKYHSVGRYRYLVEFDFPKEMVVWSHFILKLDELYGPEYEEVNASSNDYKAQPNPNWVSGEKQVYLRSGEFIDFFILSST